MRRRLILMLLAIGMVTQAMADGMDGGYWPSCHMTRK
jgi:hypothetical protein